MRRLTSMVLGLALLLLVPPLAHARPSMATAQVALDRIEKVSPEPWRVRWDDNTGAPIAIYGSRTASLDADPAQLPDAVGSFLMSHRELFQLRPGIDGFQLDRVIEIRGIRHIKLDQTYRGIPVIGAGYNVAVDANGSIRAIMSSSVPGLTLDVAGAALSKSMTGVAQAAVEGGLLLPGSTPRLSIDPSGATPRLVQEVRVQGMLPGDVWTVLVDARSGEVVSRGSEVARSTGLANAYSDPCPFGGVTEVTLPRLVDGTTSLQGSAVRVFNEAGSPVISATRDFRYAVDDPLNFAQPHAYYHVDKYLADVRAMGYEESIPFVAVHVNADPSYGYGWYTNNVIYIPKATSFNFAYSPGILVHEAQHHVSHSLGLVPANTFHNESRALDEGLSEYFQASYFNQPNITPPPSCSLTVCAQGTYPISAQNSPLVFRFTNYDNLQNVCGWPAQDDHTNGLIVAGALWDLRTSVGAQVADRLALGAIPYLPNNPTMGCYFDALFMADQELYGWEHMMPVLLARVNRYLNCTPKPVITGPHAFDIGTPTTFAVETSSADCGLVPYSNYVWQRRPHCTTGTCEPWVEIPETEYYPSIEITETAEANFDLRAIVTDTWSRSGTTPVFQAHSYPPFSVGISGPGSYSSQNCNFRSWTSSVTGGNTPLVYQWDLSDHGAPRGTWNTANISTNLCSYVPNDLTLILGVLSADGRADFDTVLVAYAAQAQSATVADVRIDCSAVQGLGASDLAVTLWAPRMSPHARLEVYDITGRRVAVPHDGTLKQGPTRITWARAGLSSGTYFYRLKIDELMLSRQFVLIR